MRRPVFTTSEECYLRGVLLARLLSGVWRDPLPADQFTAQELDAIVNLLLESGSGALGWWRVRDSSISASASAIRLREAYRLHAIKAAIFEQGLASASSILRIRGFDPLLGKGWAVARSYPESGLRPYGDADLYVREDQYDAFSEQVIRERLDCPVDGHKGTADLADRSFDEVFNRSQLVSLGQATVRVMGPEDHLRLLCLHMLRHGAWRPLWLCDVAIALEARPADFDWAYFLSGNRKRSDWAACAIGLAHQLLGAQVADTPVAERAQRLPGWLIPTVLMQWGRGQVPHGTRMPMGSYLRDPAGLLTALRLRWPNAIEATVGVRGSFNDLPRLPFQLGECVTRTVRFCVQVAQFKA